MAVGRSCSVGGYHVFGREAVTQLQGQGCPILGTYDDSSRSSGVERSSINVADKLFLRSFLISNLVYLQR